MVTASVILVVGLTTLLLRVAATAVPNAGGAVVCCKVLSLRFLVEAGGDDVASLEISSSKGTVDSFLKIP
jgi:hypothetical protein